jgi:hypothetical protein
MDVTDREHFQAARAGAAIVWALRRLHPDSLRIVDASFDLRMGSAPIRQALLRGADPDEVIDGEVSKVVAWQQRVRKHLLYR